MYGKPYLSELLNDTADFIAVKHLLLPEQINFLDSILMHMAFVTGAYLMRIESPFNRIWRCHNQEENGITCISSRTRCTNRVILAVAQ